MRVEASVTSLGDLLGRHTFQVSPYQRDYSWTEDEVDTLFQDLKAAYRRANDPDPVHFFGSIVLLRRSGGTRVDIVDGQQRLATFTLLLAAIRNTLELRNDRRSEGALEYIMREDKIARRSDPIVELNAHDEPFFEKVARVHIKETAIEAGKEARDSHKRIAKNYTKLVELVRNEFHEENSESLPRFLSWLLKGSQFVRIDSDDEDSAFTLFECLNDRGIALTNADIVKNYLFSKIKDPLDEAIKQWDEVLDKVGQDSTKSYIRHEWITRAGYIEEKAVLREVKTNILDKSQATKYLEDLAELADLYSFLIDPQGKEESKSAFGVSVRAISIFGTSAYLPLFLALEKVGRPLNDKRLGDAMAKLARFVELHAFRYYVLGGLQSGRLGAAVGQSATLIAQCKGLESVNACLKPLRDMDIDDSHAKARAVEKSFNQKVANYILLKIESSKSVVNESSATRVMRVMPKKVVGAWAHIKPEIQKAHADRIGNYFLVGGKAGIREDDSFEKKQAFFERSRYTTTNELYEYACWESADLERRTLAIAELVPGLWPGKFSFSL